MSAGAVHSPHRLVRASAGSGKTFQLTNVLLGLLLDGEDPGALLATTFTRAAAGEILHRALARLSAAAIDADALGELRDHIDPSLTHERCAGALKRVVGEMHRLSVMTIDALFARLASSFSLEIGLAPGWRMLDKEEDDQLRAAAVDRALRDAPQDEFVELLRDLHGEEIRIHAHKAVMDVVDQGYAALLETDDDAAPWSAIGPVGRRLDAQGINAACAALAEAEVATTKTGAPNKNWERARAGACDAAQAGQWERFVSSGLGEKAVKAAAAGEVPNYYNTPFPESMERALAPLIEHARYTLTHDHARRTLAALELLRRFDAVYSAMKRSLGGVTFADPPRMLLAAGTTGDLDHLYFRLDARVRHVLLDEFQDTSMTQFRLLAPLLDELLSQDADGRRVFCVGDAKQSLYTWREAEPTLLPNLPKRWPTLIEESLAQSWRSSQAVLDMVNGIFASTDTNAALLPEPAAARAAREWADAYEPHRAAHERLSGEARLLVAEEPEDEPRTDAQANHDVLLTAAERVLEAQHRAPRASIAVLVRRNADLRAILGMLKRRGVDASEQRGNPLVDAPPVAAAASLLRVIDHPGHTAALHHVASTPLGEAVGLTDPADAISCERVASRLRAHATDIGCAGLLAQWFEACAHAMDARSGARFRQFIDLAESIDESGNAPPARLADIAESRRIEEPGSASVKVMTIHAAKGLEYDVVILPLRTGPGALWSVDKRSVVMTRDDPLGPVTRVSRYPNETMRALHPQLEELHQRAHQRQINEEMCCLYVAATRARRCLEIIVPADKPGRAGEALGLGEYKARADHVVRAALAPELPASPGEELWATQTGADWAQDERVHAPTAAPPRPEEPEVALRVRAPAVRSALRLAGASPSAERSGAPIDAAALLTRHDRRGRRVGEIVHFWFERIGWIASADTDDAALMQQARREGFDEQIARNALAAIRAALDSPPLRAALDERAWLAAHPEAQRTTAHLERPFAVRDADRLLEGRFDRLVVGGAAGRAVCAQVMDFKTDAAARGLDAAALAAYAESHRPQMEAYRRAASHLLGVSPERVEATLAFTAAGEVVTLPHQAGAPPG